MRVRVRSARVRDERGIALVVAAGGMVAFMAATMLAVDVGLFMVARTQAQVAADAGALAGAVALVFDSWDDRSAGGPAVQNAMAAATASANAVMHVPVSVEAGDVTFPQPERVRVQVHRTAARDNPILPLIAPMFGIDAVDLGAAATAEAVRANAATCVKPWAVPDRWDERQTPAWDETDTFQAVYQNGPRRGEPIPSADVYVPADQPGYTGYVQSPQGPDHGRQVLLKPGNPRDAANSSHFFPIALPGGTGGRWYEQNIGSCWPDVAVIGALIPVEPGNQTGPTVAGTEALVAKDPDAYWDASRREVVSSRRPSPRIVIIPVFDPYVYDVGRERGRLDIKVANFVGFFIEDMVGNDVLGRIVPTTGLIRGNGGSEAAPAGAFLRAIRLVE